MPGMTSYGDQADQLCEGPACRLNVWADVIHRGCAIMFSVFLRAKLATRKQGGVLSLHELIE